MFKKTKLQLLCLSVFLQSATYSATIPLPEDEKSIKRWIYFCIHNSPNSLLQNLQNLPETITRTERNEILEKAFFCENWKEITLFLFDKNIGANQLGMNDILRMATSGGSVDKVRFILFDIPEGQQHASEDTILSLAKNQKNQTMIDLFMEYASLH